MALSSFVIGGDTRTDHGPRERRFTDSIRGTSIAGRGCLSACCSRLRDWLQGGSDGAFFKPFAIIILTALAMGIRNAAVRKLAIPDLTTTTDPNGHGYR